MNRESGFTLLELVIILLVAGLIATPFIQQYQRDVFSTPFGTTEVNFSEIQESVGVYYERFGYLPCPAENFYDGSAAKTATIAVNDSADADDFGLEFCKDFETELNDVNATVLIGSVPVRALGLDASYALDGWGNKITYVVSKYMVNIDRYNAKVANNASGIIPLQPVSPLTGATAADEVNTSTFPWPVAHNAHIVSPNSCINTAVGGFSQRSIKRGLESADGTATAYNGKASALISSANTTIDVQVVNGNVDTHIDNICETSVNVMAYINAEQAALNTSNHVLLISHGATAAGAYNANGALVQSCDSATHDGQNCERNSAANNLFYTNDLYLDSSDVPGDTFYDDVALAFRTIKVDIYTSSRDTSGTATGDSYSEYDYLGIGATDPMGGAVPALDSLGNRFPGVDVGGDIKVISGAGGSGRAISAKVCSEEGSHNGKCFEPTKVGKTGMLCTDNRIVNGFSDNSVSCYKFVPFVPNNCPSNQYVVGVDASANIICKPSP